MRIASFVRRALPGQRSIERAQSHLLAALPPGYVGERFVCPEFSRTPIEWWRNIRACSVCQGDVNHVVGDAYYIALGMDPRHTLLSFMDTVNLRRLTGLRRAVFKAVFFTLPLRRVAMVTAISESTRDELIQEVPEARGKVQVIPLPYDPSFTPEPTPMNRRPVLLQVGTRSNKNLERVLEALRGWPGKFVVVGEATDEQRRLIESSGVDVDLHENVDSLELRRLYVASDATIFASTYEGQGLPILESQAIGRPVITSNLSPMREVAGGAAQLVDPTSATEIRTAVEQVFADRSRYTELVEAGLANVEPYSARTIARCYADLYDQLGVV